MAIIFDSTSNGIITSGTTITFSHVAASGSGLFVAVYDYGGGPNPTATYDGVSMTHVLSFTHAGNIMHLYFLSNPSSGTHNIIVTRSGNLFAFAAISASYTVISSSQPDSSSTSTVTSSSMTASTTVVASNSWLLGISANINGSSYASYASNLTDRRKTTFTTNSDNIAFILSDSNSTVGTGSQSINYSGGGNAVLSTILISIAPGSTPGTNSNFLAFMM